MRTNLINLVVDNCNKESIKQLFYTMSEENISVVIDILTGDKKLYNLETLPSLELSDLEKLISEQCYYSDKKVLSAKVIEITELCKEVRIKYEYAEKHEVRNKTLCVPIEKYLDYANIS